MPKRPAFPHYGDHKKPKLEFSRSDHHLPSSQNISTANKENNCDVWGDDDDEQMLLQASQACEEEQINDISMLPDYSIWKQPGSTSTQYQSPSTSKFEFKKPSSIRPSSVSTQLKNKCNTISSPLPGISTMLHGRHSNLTDDLGMTDRIVSAGHESDVYRQMQLLKEENDKLKFENCKLSDKVETKDGEVSILRSQLRATQAEKDNVRIEKIKAQEKVQMEYSEKLLAVTKEKESLKAQLEFKDLEILSVKDKFKKLESNKLRLTQVNDVSRHNNTQNALYDAGTQHKRAKMTSNSAQTEDKAPFLKLNKSCRKGVSKPHAGFSVSPTGSEDTETQKDVQLFDGVCRELTKLEGELRAAAHAAREPNPAPVLTVSPLQLLSLHPLYKAERGVSARRHTAELYASDADARSLFRHEARAGIEHGPTIMDTAVRICDAIERNSCGVFYSGFLKALIVMFGSLLTAADLLKPKILSVTKAVLLSKPMPFVTLEMLTFFRRLSSIDDFLPSLCPGSPTGSLGMDVDQEVNNSESCYFVMLLKQTDDVVSCIRQHGCGRSALDALRSLLDIFVYVYDRNSGSNRSCVCRSLSARALVRALRAAAAVAAAADDRDKTAMWYQPLLAACRSCVLQVYKCVASDAAWVPALHRYEGLLSDALHNMHKVDPNLTELSELKNTFQTVPEDAPPSYLQQPFMDSFESFSMTD